MLGIYFFFGDLPRPLWFRGALLIPAGHFNILRGEESGGFLSGRDVSRFLFLSGRFLLITHVGRRSGIARRTVLEVIHHDRQADALFVAAAWGEKAQWFQNVQQEPRVAVTAGRRRVTAIAERVSTGEAERVLRIYANRHRIAMRALARLLGSDDIPTLARTIPIIALRVRG